MLTPAGVRLVTAAPHRLGAASALPPQGAVPAAAVGGVADVPVGPACPGGRVRQDAGQTGGLGRVGLVGVDPAQGVAAEQALAARDGAVGVAQIRVRSPPPAPVASVATRLSGVDVRSSESEPKQGTVPPAEPQVPPAGLYEPTAGSTYW